LRTQHGGRACVTVGAVKKTRSGFWKIHAVSEWNTTARSTDVSIARGLSSSEGCRSDRKPRDVNPSKGNFVVQ
jgi:hypothetical protein